MTIKNDVITMREKYIEEASKTAANLEYDLGLINDKEYNIAKRFFQLGVNWLSISTWHNVKEIPKENISILAMNHLGLCKKVFFTNPQEWDLMIEKDKFIYWSYIIDLIPYWSTDSKYEEIEYKEYLKQQRQMQSGKVTPMQQGWICPKCGKAYSPYERMCISCYKKDIINANNIQQSPLGDLSNRVDTQQPIDNNNQI